MADEPTKKPDEPATPVTPPTAAADKPPGEGTAEPLKGEVSRTDAPGAGVSAAPPAKPAVPAPKPASPSAATTAKTAAAAAGEGKPASAKPGADAPPAAKPAVPAGAKPPAAGAAAKPAPAPKHPAPPAPPPGPPDPPPPDGVALPAFIQALQGRLPEAVTQVSYWVGDWTVIVPSGRLMEVAGFLRSEPGAAFDYCSDVTASDWPTRAQRFDVVYCLYSTSLRHRVRVKVRAAEAEPVPSVAGLWPAANWLEREVYDLFGVNFVGHPDLRRILMPDNWQGHPQRKDYPLEGPGELLMESPLDWLKIRNAEAEADIE